mmetsp:Transcript_9737/g.11201  ORF Transcript_9737/g.11201 Transcript_9737/m.11201 type:complete len:89 (+) Transcript_9737:1108-1374(+)
MNSILFKINDDVMCGGLHWELRFEVEEGKTVDYDTAEKQQLEPWFHGGQSLHHETTISNTMSAQGTPGKSKTQLMSYNANLESFLENL